MSTETFHGELVAVPRAPVFAKPQARDYIAALRYALRHRDFSLTWFIAARWLAGEAPLWGAIPTSTHKLTLGADAKGRPPLLGAGEWVGDYQIVKLILRVDWADTYDARARWGEPVVLKTLSPDVEVPGDVAALEDEADLVEHSTHGGIPRFFARGWHGESPYFVMEKVDGADLRDIWNLCARKGIAFPVRVAVHIVRELAAIVAAFEHAGLVHRNLSPCSVAISRTGEVKVIEFMATDRLQTRLWWKSASIRPCYRSPEVLRGRAIDSRSDLFNLGIMLWEMLTGYQLFPEKDASYVERIRNAQVPLASDLGPPRVPPDLDRITAKALARRKWRRFRTAVDFASALDGCSAGGAERAELTAFMSRVLGA